MTNAESVVASLRHDKESWIMTNTSLEHAKSGLSFEPCLFCVYFWGSITFQNGGPPLQLSLFGRLKIHKAYKEWNKWYIEGLLGKPIELV